MILAPDSQTLRCPFVSLAPRMSMMNTTRLYKMSERSYERAIEILNSRRRQQRPDSLLSPSSSNELSKAMPARGQLKGSPSIAGMEKWLLQLGHKAADVNRLNIIHVAGTKGKGSTCAFTESFLRAYGERTGFPSKTGLYTSPHLIYPEERIRIGFRPISRGLFAKYFFEVWNSLLSDAENRPLPRYLQLMALTAFHAFIMENVEATIIETHHGGEYDATNVIEAPLVTMVTALGMDHVQQLGPSVENIAWHKSGIFKPGAYALSVLQDDCVADVLRKRATEKDVNLVFVDDDSALPNEALQLRPDVQRTNCSLALAGTRAFLKAKFRDHEFALLPQDVRQGVERFMWPGRFQVIEDGTSRWYLDGAHNEMSIVKAAEWYIDLTEAAGPIKKVLIFGHVSDTRDAAQLVTRLAKALSTTRVDCVIFTHYEPSQDFHKLEDLTSCTPIATDLEAMNAFEIAWKTAVPSAQIMLKQNINDAIVTARAMSIESGAVHTLITGSQHLVGGALFCLGNDRKAACSTQHASQDQQ